MIADLIFLTPQSNSSMLPLTARSLGARSKGAAPLLKLLAAWFQESGDTSQDEAAHEIFYQTSRTTVPFESGGEKFQYPFSASLIKDDDWSRAAAKETEERLARARRLAAERQQVRGTESLS